MDKELTIIFYKSIYAVLVLIQKIEYSMVMFTVTVILIIYTTKYLYNY